MKVLIFIAYLCGVFLVPLIPAYIVYKLLPPSKTKVGGPFKGLKINLTGAFGGYFLLVLIALSLVFFFITPPKPQLEVWTLTGIIQTKSMDPNIADVSDDFAGTEINTKPETFLVDSEGQFNIKVAVIPDDIKGIRNLKGLEFIRDGYYRRVLCLDTVERIVTKDEKTITFEKPIVLMKLKEEEKPKWD